MIAAENSDNPFHLLFPHRYDYIWAEHCDPNTKVEWKTESRHPLSDRLLQQGSYLYGVRFGASTCYCLLDIDSGSPYHPKRDPFAIPQIVTALESLGLVSYVACTSSYSGGLHLYFPFQHAQSSWKLAIAVTVLLEAAGFKLKPGQLEVFPDPKPYNVNGKPSLFNAHRLPLQIGSYLVDDDFQPIWSSQQRFVQQWQFAQGRNDVRTASLQQVLKQVKRQRYAISNKAEKFINDLNAEIELGWTGFGQTNYLLGRITMREYVFRHVLSGGQPLQGIALIEAVVSVAQSLPGYGEYCRHRHEIERRAQEWVRCIENSHYFHYGDASGKFNAKRLDGNDVPCESRSAVLQMAADQSPSWNHQQTEEARDRIKWAIAALLEQGSLPATATARFRALIRYGIGGGTLYRHRDLWHPAHLTTGVSVENPPHPPVVETDSVGDCYGEASPTHCPSSLFPYAGSNQATGEAFSDRNRQNSEPGRNFSGAQVMSKEVTTTGMGDHPVHWEADITRSSGWASQEAVRTALQYHRQRKRQAAEARLIARMQQFMDSGDPVLMAEAIAWAKTSGVAIPDAY